MHTRDSGICTCSVGFYRTKVARQPHWRRPRLWANYEGTFCASQIEERFSPVVRHRDKTAHINNKRNSLLPHQYLTRPALGVFCAMIGIGVFQATQRDTPLSGVPLRGEYEPLSHRTEPLGRMRFCNEVPNDGLCIAKLVPKKKKLRIQFCNNATKDDTCVDPNLFLASLIVEAYAEK